MTQYEAIKLPYSGEMFPELIMPGGLVLARNYGEADGVANKSMYTYNLETEEIFARPSLPAPYDDVTSNAVGMYLLRDNIVAVGRYNPKSYTLDGIPVPELTGNGFAAPRCVIVTDAPFLSDGGTKRISSYDISTSYHGPMNLGSFGPLAQGRIADTALSQPASIAVYDPASNTIEQTGVFDLFQLHSFGRMIVGCTKYYTMTTNTGYYSATSFGGIINPLYGMRATYSTGRGGVRHEGKHWSEYQVIGMCPFGMVTDSQHSQTMYGPSDDSIWVSKEKEVFCLVNEDWFEGNADPLHTLRLPPCDFFFAMGEWVLFMPAVGGTFEVAPGTFETIERPERQIDTQYPPNVNGIDFTEVAYGQGYWHAVRIEDNRIGKSTPGYKNLTF